MAKPPPTLPQASDQAGNLPDHPALGQGRFFFTLPIELLEAVVDAVGEKRFDQDLLAIDRSLSCQNGDHSDCIGFHNEQPIHYRLLTNPLSVQALILNLSNEMKAELGWEPALFNQSQRSSALDDVSNWIREICSGYCGWLLLNPLFIQEQQQFLVQSGSIIRQWGLAAPLTSTLTRRPAADHVKFAIARKAFLERWQLKALVGPGLPSPFTPQMPVSRALVSKLPEQGTLLFFPTIFPIPDRDFLKEMIENTMHRDQASAHLKEWCELVESNSPDKKRIARLGRLFRLHHFWRTLFARHAQALDGKLEQVREAFASFLIPKVEAEKGAASIEKDLGDLSKAHGDPDWFRHPLPCDQID